MANAELTASFRVRTCVYIQLHTWKHQCLKVCILITKDGASEARKLDHNWVRRASKKDSVKELTLGLTPNELQAQVAPLTCCALQGRKMLTEAHACSQLSAGRSPRGEHHCPRRSQTLVHDKPVVSLSCWQEPCKLL